LYVCASVGNTSYQFGSIACAGKGGCITASVRGTVKIRLAVVWDEKIKFVFLKRVERNNDVESRGMVLISSSSAGRSSRCTGAMRTLSMLTNCRKGLAYWTKFPTILCSLPHNEHVA